MARRLIFTATRKDFRVQCFPAGGPGGQHQNKVSSAVRITHLATGLKGESREERSQYANKQRAFRRLCDLLVKHYTHDTEAKRLLMDANAKTIRTYHEPDNRVVDKACDERWTYMEIVGKGNIAEPLEARRLALLSGVAREAYGGLDER